MMRRGLALIFALIGSCFAVTGAAAGEPKRIAIANFGPHGSLEQVIAGFKAALAEKGFVEGQGVTYDYSDCQFDPALIPQVLSKLEAHKPDLMLTVTTPMTQGAVKAIRDPALPIVFAPVTDPVAAGLVPDWQHGSARFVGASNMQPMDAVLALSRKLLGDVKSVGLLYNPGDANDVANKAIAEAAAKAAGIELKAVGVDTVSDIPQRVTALQGTDFVYAIPSSLLMPALPAIVANTDRLKIPVITASPQGAQEHLALAAVTVSWTKVGHEAGLIAARVLAGEKPGDLPNYKPSAADLSIVISTKRMKQSGRQLPAALADCNCLVD